MSIKLRENCIGLQNVTFKNRLKCQLGKNSGITGIFEEISVWEEYLYWRLQ